MSAPEPANADSRYIDALEYEDDDATDVEATATAPHRERTRRLRENLQASGDTSGRVLRVLECLEDEGLDLPLFLWALSWNPEFPELVSDGKARYARTALTHSIELPEILWRWNRPPRRHGVGVRTRAAHPIFESMASEIVKGTINAEMEKLAPALRSPQEDYWSSTGIILHRRLGQLHL